MVEAVRAPPRIAVIDDDKSAREAIEGLMRALGYETFAFPSADQFLVSQVRSEVGCIVSDIQMPGRSGLDLKNVLEAVGDSTPIIFVTGLPRGDRRRAEIEAGPCNLLPKPVDTDELIRCVGEALAAPR